MLLTEAEVLKSWISMSSERISSPIVSKILTQCPNSSGIAWSFTPSCPPDHSKIHHVLEPSIDAEHIILHLRLLRLFKEFKQNVKEWAASEEVNTDRLWVFTMNLATKRMFRWFSASFEYQLQEITPPIDVLLIWYCFLLRPAEWQQYVTETNLTLKCWSWPMLVCPEKHQ
jgi:hypothetical protein